MRLNLVRTLRSYATTELSLLKSVRTIDNKEYYVEQLGTIMGIFLKILNFELTRQNV